MSLRVLTVCTHNRTRSVIISALFSEQFDTLGIDGAVRSRGLLADGNGATARTVDLLADRGIDIRDHVSRRVTPEDIERADLIVTAERDHVVQVVGMCPDAFRKTMTLPEAVALSRRSATSPRDDLDAWLDDTLRRRPSRLDYLDADHIGEISDPTGKSPAEWRDSLAIMTTLTAELAERL